MELKSAVEKLSVAKQYLAQNPVGGPNRAERRKLAQEEKRLAKQAKKAAKRR